MGTLRVSPSYDHAGGKGVTRTETPGTEPSGTQCCDGDLCQQLCSLEEGRVSPGLKQKALVPALPKPVASSKQFGLISQIK